MMNILNGGAHTSWQTTDAQEFMVMPLGASTFAEASAGVLKSITPSKAF